MKDVGKSLSSGFVSGLLGSLCCVGPLVLVLIGLSGVSGAMALSGTWTQQYRWTLFIPLAVLFLSGSIYFHIRKKAGVCNLKTIRHYKTFVITTIIFSMIIWVLLLYVIVPVIFSMLS
jgi:hypothetical protein